MKIKLVHSVIKSPIFELVGIYEIDFLINEDSFALRIELFRSLSDQKTYRYRILHDEFFRIQSTFPMDENGHHLDGPSDEILFVNTSMFDSGAGVGGCEPIFADNDEEALMQVLNIIGNGMQRMTNEPLIIENLE